MKPTILCGFKLKVGTMRLLCLELDVKLLASEDQSEISIQVT